jgi:uncharacterized protein (TIGR02145 family)
MKQILTLAALVFATACFGQEVCPNMYDGNGNGTIDIEDFLGILGLFGDVDVDSDGLWDSQDGCIDLAACNFSNPSAQSCVYPDAFGACFLCGDPFSYQGYDYTTVLIGEQCWFAENLRAENYENGDEILAGLNDDEWASVTSGATTVFGEGNGECFEYVAGNDPDPCDEAWSLNEYGRLYNWLAVDDDRGLCPSGWHVPTYGEWIIMIDELGGLGVAGNEMKSEYGWYYSNGNGSNSSGFSALPGGFRFFEFFDWGGSHGFWWTSSSVGSACDAFGHKWSWEIYSSMDIINDGSYAARTGLSVRCIQDSE